MSLANPMRISLLLFSLFLPILMMGQDNNDVHVILKNQTFSSTISSSPNAPIVTDQPLHGTVSNFTYSNGEFHFTYSPDWDFTGLDEFAVEVWENTFTYGYRLYKIKVVESIVEPKPDYAFLNSGGSISKNVLNNDFGSNPPLSIKNISLAENGTASISNGDIQFTPDAGFLGMAQVTYTVCDNQNTCATGLLNISVVNGNPSTTGLSLFTRAYESIIYPLGWPNYGVSVSPGYGQVEINDFQELIYTPNADFVGEDAFTLMTYNGTPSELNVSVKVYPNVPANQMAMPDLFYTPKDNPIEFNVQDNDYGNFVVKGFSKPMFGDLTYMGSGHFSYTPPIQYSGGQEFFYSIGNMFNPNAESTSVRIGIGDQEPSKGTFELTASTNTPLVIDYPVPFLDFGFEFVNEPDHGTLDFYEGWQSLTLNGETVEGYNLLIYTPNAGFEGLDEFDVNYCLFETENCYETKIKVQTQDAPENCIQHCVWPGDANNDGVVSVADILPIGLYFGETGLERDNGTTNWYGQQATDWNNPYTQAQLKHIDTDGDGQITSNDTLAISQSYGSNNNLTPSVPRFSKGINIQFGTPSVANPLPGDYVEIPLILGTDDQPAESIYGFTYNINYWVDAFENATIEYLDDSWLAQNDATLDMVKTPLNGRIETAFTRTGKMSASGEGIIGSLNFIIDEQVDGIKGTNGVIDLTIDASEVIDGAGTVYAIGGDKTSIRLNLSGMGLQHFTADQVILKPNPSNDFVYIHLNSGFVADEIHIFDMQGRLIEVLRNINNNQVSIDLASYKSAMYLAKVITADGVATKKFEVVKEF